MVHFTHFHAFPKIPKKGRKIQSSVKIPKSERTVWNSWEKLKNHELNLIRFHPERIENVGNTMESSINIRFVTKTSDIRIFSENITSDVKTSEVAKLVAGMFLLKPWHL